MHIGRYRKREPGSRDSESLNLNQWMNMVGTVNKCGEAMEDLRARWGDLPFAICVTAFMDIMPQEIMMQVERARYQNTILQEKSGITGKLGRGSIPKSTIR